MSNYFDCLASLNLRQANSKDLMPGLQSPPITVMLRERILVLQVMMLMLCIAAEKPSKNIEIWTSERRNILHYGDEAYLVPRSNYIYAWIIMDYLGLKQKRHIYQHRSQWQEIVNTDLHFAINQKNEACIQKDFEMPAQLSICEVIVELDRHRSYESTSYGIDVYLDKKNFSKCFQMPPYHYQAVRVILRCRFILERSVWWRNYTQRVITPAVPPERPPTIWRNGFFHDSENNKLYVFWAHLGSLEWNGPNFTYNVRTEDGLEALIVGNTSAVFPNWDPQHSANVFVWSKNSKGLSHNSSHLEVPILTKSQRQPRNLRYFDENKTLIWEPPIDDFGLEEYFVYWCHDSPNSLQICNDTPIQNRSVKEQLYVTFEGSMFSCNLAVSGSYKDQVASGMQWTGPKWIPPRTINPSLYLVPVGISSLIFLIFAAYRKLRQMSDIEVVLPDFLTINETNEFRKTRSSPQTN